MHTFAFRTEQEARKWPTWAGRAPLSLSLSFAAGFFAALIIGGSL